MIYINNYTSSIILWACFCCISAPSPPSTAEESSNYRAGLSQEKLLRESVRLYKYVQIIKTIDVERSMESVAELMNMLRLIFPIRFAKIERKIFDMYDPLTNRRFGVAFRALMNILRVKSKRDELRSIFHELTVPEVLVMSNSENGEEGREIGSSLNIELPSQSDDKSRDKNSPTPIVSNDVPIDDQTTVGLVNWSENREKYPKPKKTLRLHPKIRSQKSIPIAGGEDDDETFILRPVTSPPQRQKSRGTRIPVTRDSASSQVYSTQKKLEDPAVGQEGNDYSSDTDRKLARLKSLLERVKKSNVANPQLQARAALFSKALAEQGVTPLFNNHDKIRLERKGAA